MFLRIITFFSFLLFIGSTALTGQELINLKGQITDAQTGEGLPFATVSFVGNENVGTTADIDGYYELSTKWGTDKIKAEYLGYTALEKDVDLALKKQEIAFALATDDYVIEGVEIVAKKKRYSRKNNPAVELIKKVIANKDKNRLAGQDYYQCDQYEKLEFAINNFESSMLEKGMLKDFKFLAEYVDTSEINGKPFLPFFLRETDSDIYYQKSPTSRKEFVQHKKETKLDQALFDQNLNTVLELIYQDVDIYSNKIKVFAKNIVSPVSSNMGNAFYHYHIMDTIDYAGKRVIDLAYMPVNKKDIGFKGHIYIMDDDTYAIVKAEMSLDSRANLNFVNDLKVVQEFERYDDKWIVSRDELYGDFGMTKGSKGLYGKRSVNYSNYIFNQKADQKYYDGKIKVVDEMGSEKENESVVWDEIRPDAIRGGEERIYAMVDTLKGTKAFKRISNLTSIVTSGYWSYDKFQLGPVASFFSFNDIEGVRFRVGGKTTPELFPKFRVVAYGAYGLDDKKFKVNGNLIYSFNDNFNKNPKTQIKLTFFHDIQIVGQDVELLDGNSLALSFRRGDASRFIFRDYLKLEWEKEYVTDFSHKIYLSNTRDEPLANLKFNYQAPDGSPQTLNGINTTEVGFRLRYAPNEKFIQLHDARRSIFTEYPVFQIDYGKGLADVLEGDYDYHKLVVSGFKRIYLQPIGQSDIILEGGKIWGQNMPYYLLLAPRGNQSFIYKTELFNMMNFLEFTTDTYISFNYRHFFDGFIFNRIPLINKLGLRAMVTFKGVWGNLSDGNNPNKNPELVQFATVDNVPQTYTFTDEVYMEASFGIANIFRVLRVDAVQRFNYLDHPNVPNMFGWRGFGLRVKSQIEF